MPDPEALAFLARLAGDEEDLVPAVLEAAEAGGPAWRELVRPPATAMLGGVAEAADPGLLALTVELLHTAWPVIAEAARAAARALTGELGMLAKDGAVTGAAAVTILRWLKERNATELPTPVREQLVRGLDEMQRHLVALGLDAERARTIAQNVLVAACADPKGADAVARARPDRR
jgi:hypothetical protein